MKKARKRVKYNEEIRQTKLKSKAQREARSEAGCSKAQGQLAIADEKISQEAEAARGLAKVAEARGILC